jgi:hypothetical protein
VVHPQRGGQDHRHSAGVLVQVCAAVAAHQCSPGLCHLLPVQCPRFNQQSMCVGIVGGLVSVRLPDSSLAWAVLVMPDSSLAWAVLVMPDSSLAWAVLVMLVMCAGVLTWTVMVSSHPVRCGTSMRSR